MTTTTTAPAVQNLLADLEGRWASLTDHAHNWREYTRINGVGPHSCECCGARAMGPGACFDTGIEVHCGCHDPIAEELMALIEDLADAAELYRLAGVLVDLANNPPTEREGESLAGLIDRGQAWEHDQREARQELNRACVRYARRHGVAGEPLGTLREAALNGWPLSTGNRTRTGELEYFAEWEHEAGSMAAARRYAADALMDDQPLAAEAREWTDEDGTRRLDLGGPVVARRKACQTQLGKIDEAIALLEAARRLARAGEDAGPGLIAAANVLAGRAL